jgi:hypothetical protein
MGVSHEYSAAALVLLELDANHDLVDIGRADPLAVHVEALEQPFGVAAAVLPALGVVRLAHLHRT